MPLSTLWGNNGGHVAATALSLLTPFKDGKKEEKQSPGLSRSLFRSFQYMALPERIRPSLGWEIFLNETRSSLKSAFSTVLFHRVGYMAPHA